MKKLKSNTVEMLQFSGLSGEGNISHFITTRHGGVSQGNYATMNPGEFSGDDPASVRMNRQLLSDAMQRRERLVMSKNELRSSGKHRRCAFANGACERYS